MWRPLPVVLGALTLLNGVLRAPSASAKGAPVSVDCPAFDDETRAALDARARAELLVRQQGGTLVVSCRTNDALLTWHPSTGNPRRESRRSIATPGRASITFSKRSTLYWRARRRTILGPKGPRLHLRKLNPRRAPHRHTARTARSQARGTGIRAANWQRRGGSTRERDAASRVSHRFRSRVVGELWSRNEALGAHAFATLPLPSRFSVSVTGEASGPALPEGIDANLVRIAAGGDYGIDPAEHFRVGADAFVDFVHAESAQAGADDKAFVGASLRATAGFQLGAVRLQFGPTVSIHPGKVVIQIGDTEAFHVPTFAAGLRLDGVIGF